MEAGLLLNPSFHISDVKKEQTNSSDDVTISLPWWHCPGWQHLQPAERRPVAGMQRRTQPEHQPPPTWPQNFPSASGTQFSPGSYMQKKRAGELRDLWRSAPQQLHSTHLALVKSASDTLPSATPLTWATAALITYAKDRRSPNQ